MIFSFKKNCTSRFAIAGLLTIALTGCGGGGSEGSNALGGTNSSAATVLPSSTPAAVISSAPASSSAPSSSSAVPVATSSSAPSSTPVQATKSSSPAQSSYARSSRASSSLADLDDDIIYPEEPEEFFDLPPTAPRNVKLEVISSNTAIISWSPATDDVGLSRYEIRRDGVAIGTSVASNLEYEDIQLSHNTYYTYTVRAIDIAGNRSNFSNALIVKTTSINTHNTSSNSSNNNSKSSSSNNSTATSAVSSIGNTSSNVSETSSASSNDSSDNSSIALSSSEATSSSPASISASSEANASASSTSEMTSSSASAVSSSNATSSSTPSSTSSSSEANASSSSNDNLVSVEWITPSQRENGDYLELDEIGGYELRYRPINSSVYIREIITDKYATSYETTNASTDGLFQIAAFDTNGLYSRFITLSPR